MNPMNPILREFPYRFETDRLIIRGPLPGDGPKLHTAVTASQEHLKRWMPWAMTVPTVEQHEVRVREGQLKWLAREDLWMMLVHKETDAIIGGSGLHRINWDVPKFEIGYWIHIDYEGQGYVTEAVKAITAFAFETLGAKRVEIHCDEQNTRSAAVAQRLGYLHEATIQHDERHHLTNELRNTMIFAKIQTDDA